MKKTIVANCFTLENRDLTASDVVIPGRWTGSGIELSNGIWLQSMGDGRYYTGCQHHDTNESERWAEVLEWDDETETGTILGYCRI